MSYIPLKCKSCGADLNYKEGSVSVTCKHCGSKFLLSELLEKNENQSTKSISANGQLLKTKSEFDISDSALGTLMFVVLNIVFSFLLVTFDVKIKMGTFVYYVLHVIVEGIFALAAYIVAKAKRKNILEAAGMKKKVNGAIVGWCALTALLCLLCFGNITNVFIALLEKFGLNSENGTIEINNFGEYIGMLIGSCCVAGFAEELLFRGVIQSGFKKWGIKVAVGFSALIFMIMHGSVLQTVHQFIIGVVIGYIFYKTNNLWIGVIIHFFNNFIPVTEVYLLTELAKSGGSGASDSVTEWVVEPAGYGSILIEFIIALVVAWAGLYFIKMIYKKIIAENEKLNGKEAENETVTSIVVDGEEKEVEMSIDGATIESEENNLTEKKPEKPKVSGMTIAIFSISGLYLLLEWILGTIAMFR